MPSIPLVMEEAINGRVDYGFISVTRVFYPCTETTKFKEKKKNRFKFVKLNLVCRRGFSNKTILPFRAFTVILVS